MIEHYRRERKDVLNVLGAVTQMVPTSKRDTRDKLEAIDGLATIAAHQAEVDGEIFLCRFPNEESLSEKPSLTALDSIKSAIIDYHLSPDSKTRPSAMGEGYPVRPDVRKGLRPILNSHREKLFKAPPRERRPLNAVDNLAFWYEAQGVAVSSLATAGIVYDFAPNLSGKIALGGVGVVGAAVTVGIEKLRRHFRAVDSPRTRNK